MHQMETKCWCYETEGGHFPCNKEMVVVCIFACKETGTIMNDDDDDDVHTAVIDEDRIEGWQGQG